MGLAEKLAMGSMRVFLAVEIPAGADSMFPCELDMPSAITKHISVDTGCHMVACTVWGYLASSLEIVPLQRVQSRWQLVKISVLAAVFCLTLIAGNVSLRYIPVSFNQVEIWDRSHHLMWHALIYHSPCQLDLSQVYYRMMSHYNLGSIWRIELYSQKYELLACDCYISLSSWSALV